DLSLIHCSERDVELMLLDSESGRSCNVTLHYFSDDWHQTRLGLQERTDDGWRRAANQVQHTRRGVQIARMMPGILYPLFRPGRQAPARGACRPGSYAELRVTSGRERVRETGKAYGGRRPKAPGPIARDRQREPRRPRNRLERSAPERSAPER